MIKISDKELHSVSGMGAFDRYRYFIKRIADSSIIWALKDGQGEYALSEVETNILLSVWSSEEFIQSCLQGIWEDHTPVCLNIKDLNNVLLPLVNEKGYLIDVFPVNNKAGFVVTVNEFVHDLTVELSNYE